jgi:hypothetical protein
LRCRYEDYWRETAKAWFLPRDADVLALLSTQGHTVCDAITVVAQWVNQAMPVAQAVERLGELLAAEQQQRRAVNAGVRDSFSMPLEAEDLSNWLNDYTSSPPRPTPSSGRHSSPKPSLTTGSW